MSGKQQGLRYFQKFLNSKASERNALAKKVLRYVLAVGFVLSPWLGGEAYADAGIVPVKGSAVTFDDKNTAHIYAQQASGNVGLNRFTDFNVDKGQTANLYFKTEGTNPTVVNTLVNTVQNQISISGTVNGIKDGNVGGNLYFLSPAGMVIGSTGVINAGSLTVMTTGIDDITDPATALSQIGYVYRPLGNSPINIQGKINTANGIDLQSLSIEISKNANGDIPCLKTGMVFNSVVNTDGLVNSVSLQYEGSASGNGELQLKRSDSTDTKINLVAYKYADTYGDLVKSFGNITLSGCDVDAIGAINITSGESLNITNNTNINTNNAINIELENTNNNNQYVGDFVFESGRIEAGGMPYITVGNDINIGNDATFVSTLVTNDTINFKTQKGNISNYGNIQMQSTLNMQAGHGASGGTPCLINGGTIESQGGGLSLTAMNNITNNGTIEANAQIKFAVGGTLTNQGTIESTSSNVQAHLGRNFKNIAVYNNESTENRTLIGGIIQAGGNVQVDYKIDNEGIGVASSEEPIDGIYNSGLIWAKGDEDPVYVEAGNISSSGSGNIWLTSAYNITNDGTMKANRQITLNARDFLHNYGLIQGVTYLEIKSIMGYVYNHGFEEDGTEMAQPGRIIATGGNIALSSGQANLQIDGDTNGQKKEEYRKFTPIIIEGKVEATSALNNTTSETNQGNINIRAYLGDIYVDGGTIEAKAGPNGEVESVAGNVTLDAAQNITIGFKTEYAEADDPTTDSKDGGHPEYASETERGYYKPKSDYPLDPDPFPTYPSGKDVTISGSNIKLTSGDNEKYYILISNTTTGSNALPASNTLTASNAITINTDSMNIVGGTFNAGTLEANLAKSGALSITGGTINAANVNSNRNMIINGGAINTGTAQGSLSAKNISMESGSVTGKDVTIAAAEQVQLQGGSITAQAEGAGKLTVTAGTNLVHDGATIAADNATFSAGNKIDLQSGSLTATGAAAFGVTSGTAGANSIVESTSDYSLSAGSLSLSANQGNIILNGTNNVLQGVTIANVGGNIEIVNGNDTNKKALTIATAEGTTVGGTINVTNNGEGITVAGINAANDVNLTAGENITVAGDVNAANASFNAGQDFIQNSGTITASGAVVTAGRDVKLNAGSMEASTSVSLTAGSATSVAEGHGYISEGTEYALIAPQVTASAVKAITLDSSANQLVNVDITQVGGDLAIGSGNKNSTEALQVNIAQGITVNGSLTIKNYKDVGDNSSNDIVLAGALSANRITITNAEADINAGTDAVISADSINLQANSGAVNLDGNATITATNNGTFAANAKDINIAGGQITAGTATLTAANAINQTAGSILATTTVASAGTDLSLASKTNKLQNVTVGTQTGDATVVSSNDAGVALKVQTNGTVGGNLSIDSTSDIVSENTISAAGDVTMTAGNKVTINSGTIEANKFAANATDLSVNGGTINVGTLAASKGLNIASNSSNTTNITANNITAGGSIGITGGNVVTTSVAADEALNITGGTVSSDGAVSLSGATGVTIGSAATINTGGDLALVASGGGVTNNSELNICGSVTLSGKGNVTNTASITAEDMSMESTTGAVTNSGALNANSGSVVLKGNSNVSNSANITAAQDVTMTATTGYVNNSKVVKANGGNINLTGGTNINLQDGYGLEASNTINLNTDNMQITGGTIKANTLAASGSLDITGGSVVSTGALTISGAKGVTTGSQADITTGNNLTIASSGGAVENNRILNITTGSVTLSGSGGVTNKAGITARDNVVLNSAAEAVTNSGVLEGTSGNVELKGNGKVTNGANITAGTDVSMLSEAGDVETSGTIRAGQNIGLSSSIGAVSNASAVTATSGSVSINGNNGVTNTANITAGQAVSIISLAGAIDNSKAITANTGSVTLRGNDGVTNRVGAGITAGLKVDMISEAGAVSNSSAVQAKGGSAILNGKKDVTNAAAITASDILNIISQDGAIDNSGALTATDGSVFISGKGNIVNNDAATISAGQDVGITSDEGTINNTCSLTATTGSVGLTGKMGVINNIANGRITANDSVSMISSDGSIDNASALTATTGSVTMSGKTGVGNSVYANITANSGISMIASSGAITNSSVLDGGSGSVELKGNGKVTNRDNITAGQNIVLSSTTGAIENYSMLSAGQGIGLTSTAGTILNNGMLSARGRSVALKGYKGIINNGYIEAKGNVSIISEDGSITNRAGIVAGKSFATPAASPFSLRARAMARAVDNGSVVISGKDGVINHNDNVNTSISAAGSVSITSEVGAVQNSSAVNTSGSVEISGSNVTNSGALTTTGGSVEISGSEGVTNNADIKAGSGVSLNATTGDVKTSGTIQAGEDVSMTSNSGKIESSSAVTTSGSVEISGSSVANAGALTANSGAITMSGSNGVTNDADISARDSVSMTSNAGSVDNSNTITSTSGSVTVTGQTGVTNDNANASISAGSSVSMTSGAGAITNTSEVKATSGSVEISGNGNVNNTANITANDNVTMSSGAGSVTNSSDVKAGTGSVEISGNGGVTNTADITANQNVNLSANTGAISNAGSVTAETGNIGLNSNNGITSTAEGSSLNVNSLNGSISAATTYGEVNISEIIAGGNATASSQNGSVSIGTVAGNDVVLTGGSNVTIGSVTGSDVAITGGSNSDVNVDNITVDNSLKLQGDNITATNVNRSENASGALNVDVSGAGDNSSTAQGDVNLKIDGDVVFNNLNVTDAKIETTGNMKADSLHVEGKAQITSSNTTVNVYGKDVTPDPNDRNAIQDKGGGVSLTIDSNGVKSDDLGVDYPVQLSGKLVDYDPYDTYLEHYGDVADLFGRSDLIQASERPTGETATREEDNKVVLKQDADGLRLEEQKQE